MRSLFVRLRRGLLAGCAAAVFTAPLAGGQTAAPLPERIHYDTATRTFQLDAGSVSYVFGVDESQSLETLYWGPRLQPGDPMPSPRAQRGVASQDAPGTGEFTGSGGMMYVVPDLKITFPDGDRDLVLRYQTFRIADGTLNVTLKDAKYDVVVQLYYRPDPETGVLARWATVENHTKDAFTIEEIFAGTWKLPANDDYHLRYLTGRWADEWNVQNIPLRPGKTVLESRRGSTGADVNPWFAIERGPNGLPEGDQEAGDVWFGALGWSGSWQINIEEDSYNQVRMTGGYTPFDFSYLLKPGESLSTPKFYGGFSSHGIGGASRLLHRFELGSIVPEAPHPPVRPIVYDSWEATEFNVTEQNQEALAEKAAAIGAERFVVDDGWFGQRNTDHAGLGDWYVNPQKFPHGLKPLIDKVHSLGMDFGIWVEPEMVNPDSDLYRKHPDWVLNFPARPRTEARNQLVLNLARPDVRAYVFNFLNKLVTDNDISFLKWDYNRSWSEPGWPDVPVDEQKEVYVKYIQNLYSILAELRQKHPKLEIEDCSSGGGRVDLGILRYTDEVWTSDNTDAFDRLTIQNGFSYAYAPELMMAWVTDSPTWVNNRTLSVEYRFLSSMQGSLGVGANLSKWTPDELDTAKQMIAEYKQIRTTVQQGSLYRLILPTHGSEQSSTEYVGPDGRQVALFAFLHSSHELQPYPLIYPKGLDPAAQYKLTVLSPTPAPGAAEAGPPSPPGMSNRKVSPDTPDAASGAYWMGHGIQFMLRGDFQTALVTLEKLH